MRSWSSTWLVAVVACGGLTTPATGTKAYSCGPAVSTSSQESGAAVTLLPGISGLSNLVIGGNSLYFSSSSSAGLALVQLPVEGGALATLATPSDFGGMTADETAVYFLPPGAVAKRASVGGPVVTLATQQSGAAIAVDATDVYWINTTGPASIQSMALDGSSPRTVVQLTGLLVAPVLALDAANVYWTDNDGDVLSVAKAGGTATTLATSPTTMGSPLPTQLAVTDAMVIWTAGASTGDAFYLFGVPTAGGTVVTIATGTAAVGAASLAVDECSVYWATDVLLRVPAAGGAVTTLAATPTSGVAVDSASIYWGAVDEAAGTSSIMRLPRD